MKPEISTLLTPVYWSQETCARVQNLPQPHQLLGKLLPLIYIRLVPRVLPGEMKQTTPFSFWNMLLSFTSPVSNLFLLSHNLSSICLKFPPAQEPKFTVLKPSHPKATKWRWLRVPENPGNSFSIPTLTNNTFALYVYHESDVNAVETYLIWVSKLNLYKAPKSRYCLRPRNIKYFVHSWSAGNQGNWGWHVTHSHSRKVG